MNVRWQETGDPAQRAREVLATEAADIPRELIESQIWVEEEVALSDLRPDRQMLRLHDRQEAHVRRRDTFVEAIRASQPIPPLIALGRDLYLVDGYARYRALRVLGVERVRVLRQRFDDQPAPSEGETGATSSPVSGAG